ncbi:ParB/RepB/Spo0J family partition protein [Nocardia arthritidis]|uniref:Streptomycin biosynthesis protein n=1 Tax=Nocardia arthritidis TaxID=228602 RepID=A0A6G9YLS9_9NOCA|nr:ParB/RepB/Spo0J family partition protein [Nocardia arthritidis]QIS14255.1 streptomycin biosynthesis protein [Nocardia arthritidis]
MFIGAAVRRTPREVFDVESTFSAAGPIHELPSCSNIVDVAISELFPSDSSPRTAGADADHVRVLAESATALPPIVVHRQTMQIIDGLHRLRAAQLRGDSTIAAVFFDGSANEAFILAVKLNATHGLPLSLADRKAAALRILSSFPEWSDRAVAATVGVSPKTVSAIRRRSTVESPQSTGRIARNGVLHRSIGPEGRRRAAELFAADPNASARSVAAAAGISVTTAKDVRKRLRCGEEPVPSRMCPTDSPPKPGGTSKPVDDPTQVPDVHRVLRQLRKDPSLRFTETGRQLLRWLESPFGDQVDSDAVVRNVPSHCVPSLAELARQRSRDLQRLADLLESRAQSDATI